MKPSADSSTLPVPWPKTRYLLIAQTAITIMCAWTFVWVLGDPFVFVAPADVLVLVVLPSFLACLQVLVILLAVFRSARSRTRWLACASLVIWGLACLWLMQFVANAYVGDIVRFTGPRWAPKS